MTHGSEWHYALLNVHSAVVPKLGALWWMYHNGLLPRDITGHPELLTTGVFLVEPAGVAVPALRFMTVMLNMMTARLCMPKQMPFPLVIVLLVTREPST